MSQVVVSTTAAAIALASAVAWAASPHFISAMAALENDLSLTIKFKEAGLGANQAIHYLALGHFVEHRGGLHG